MKKLEVKTIAGIVVISLMLDVVGENFVWETLRGFVVNLGSISVTDIKEVKENE